jgi:penicillin-binding protein 2
VKLFHPHLRRSRALAVQLALFAVMGLLASAFFRLQVLRSTVWTLKAESNRLRQLPVPAPRGTIYDREGRVLADNVPGYAITLLPGPLDSMRATLERMKAYVDLPEDRIDRLVGAVRRYGREVVVDGDADFDVVSALEERKADFPNVYIDMRPRRRYILGPAAAHVLGYVGEITADELDSDAFPDSLYEQGMVVGKAGIEKEYERTLQGRQGLRTVEVDARGRIVGDFAGFTADPGTPGKDLRLNLDLELQKWIAHIFPDSLAGAVVALDPADGGVLALYSAPTYDPNAFVGGIDAKLWAQLNTDSLRPLYDRAVLGLYAPGSTFKLATAAIALDLGVVTPEERMPDPCTGAWYYGGRWWHCWDRNGHGYQTLAQAIGNSCDIYFYQLGVRIGLDRFLKKATDIGFNRPCGIDLPQESTGIFPEDRSYWEKHFGYSPQEAGEVPMLAIGQGPNSQTPLKIAQFYLALARDGSAPAPSIARGQPAGEGWHLNLSPESLAALREGLRRVTQRGGTAHVETALQYWDVLGKTGTAQTFESVHGTAEDHAWFAGMVGPPGKPPEIVVVAFVEHGAHGSSAAAPIVSKAADFYLRRKHGLPFDSVQTLGDYYRAGRGTPSWYNARFGGGG